MKRITERVLSAFTPPAILCGMSEIADYLRWFKEYPDIDIPFHVLGGILIARGIDIMTVSKLKTQWIIGGVTIVGIIWEIYEDFIGISGSGLTPESFKDIVVDIAGAYLYCLYRNEKKMMTE